MADYCLWISPPEELHEKYSHVIETLAREYDTPVFEPHVTLLGGVGDDYDKVEEKSLMLAEELDPFRIKFDSYGYTDAFFRCLFLKAENAPDLMNANIAARKVFGIEDETPVMPHLSLIYSDSIPEDVKHGVIRDLGGEYHSEFMADDFCIVRASDDIPVEDWKILREVSFKD